MTENPELSVVLPVFRTRESLPELHRRLCAALEGRRCEFLFVDDGCPAGSGEVLESLRRADPDRVRVLIHPGNRGQMKALVTGLRAARGTFTAVLDTDLEDPPEELPEMLALAEDGWDIVLGCPEEKSHGRLREALTRWLLALAHRLAPEMGGRRASTLSVLSPRAGKEYLACPGAGLAYVHPLRGLGLPLREHVYRRSPRPHGRSSYGWLRLARLGLDLLRLSLRRLLARPAPGRKTDTDREPSSG